SSVIDKTELQQLIREGGSWRSMATHFKCSLSTVRFHLRKHGLKTLFEEKLMSPNQNRRPSAYPQVKNRRDTLRKKAIEYLGGKCRSCGYAKFYGALEFHHRDPKEKDPGMNMRGT